MRLIENFQNERVLTREQVRAFDQWAIHDMAIPGMVLMENAGRGCVELIRSFTQDKPDAKVCIICGTGNNGGDGFVIARHLINSGLDVRVLICGLAEKIAGDAKANLDILAHMQVSLHSYPADSLEVLEYLRAVAGESDVIVDALFGTGLRGNLRAGYDRVVTTINQLERPVLAVDIPSGLDCNTGQVLGQAVKATWTVSFVAVKLGFTKKQARDITGLVYVASIGIEPGCWPGLTGA